MKRVINPLLLSCLVVFVFGDLAMGQRRAPQDLMGRSMAAPSGRAMPLPAAAEQLPVCDCRRWIAQKWCFV